MDVADIKHLAKLSQLELTDEEIKKFPDQLDQILDFIGVIKNVKVGADVKRDFRQTNVFREDENPHAAGQNRFAILAEMPEVSNGQLKTKKILNN